MALPEALRFPPVDEALAEKLEALAIQIIDGIDEGVDCSDPLDEVRHLTGQRFYDRVFFETLYGASSPEEFAREASRGRAPVVADLDRSTLIEALKLAAEPGEANRYYLDLLEQSLPFSGITDLIFWPDRERSFEEMADEALLRDQLGKAGGAEAVRARLIGQAEAVVSDPSSPTWAQEWAKSILEKPG